MGGKPREHELGGSWKEVLLLVNALDLLGNELAESLRLHVHLSRKRKR